MAPVAVTCCETGSIPPSPEKSAKNAGGTWVAPGLRHDALTRLFSLISCGFVGVRSPRLWRFGGRRGAGRCGSFRRGLPPRGDGAAPSDDAGSRDSATLPPLDGSVPPSDAAAPLDATPPRDAEGNEAGSLDGGEPFDAGPDAADGGAEGGVAPMGQVLVEGNNLTLIGLTSDGFVIYEKLGTVYAVPIVGGPAQTLFAAAAAQTMITGPVVYTLAAVAGKVICGGGYPIEAWTAKHGVVTLAACTTQYATVAASPDGSQLAYGSAYWNPDAGADGEGELQIQVANLDGTGTPTTVTPPSFDCSSGDGCTMEAGFAPNGMFLWWYYDSYGTEVNILSAPALSPVASFTYAAYAAGTYFDLDRSVDPTGAWLWVVPPTGGAELVRMADGTVVVTVPDGTAQAVFDPQQPYLDYITTSGGVTQLALSDTPTSTVLTTGSGTPAGLIALDSQRYVRRHQRRGLARRRRSDRLRLPSAARPQRRSDAPQHVRLPGLLLLVLYRRRRRARDGGG